MSARIYRISVDHVNRISVNSPWQYPRMGEANDRLKWARKNAKFKSARKAAEANGWNPSTYASHENGQTQHIPHDAAKKYGRKFKVSPAWILTGEGAPHPLNVAPVMGQIGAGAEILPEMEQVPEDGIDETETPFALPDDAIAFKVDGESMYPKYDPGDTVICRRANQNPNDLIGQLAAVQTLDGKRYLKTVHAGNRKDRFDLISHNAESIRNARIIWCSSILCVVPSGQSKYLKTGREKLPLKKAV